MCIAHVSCGHTCNDCASCDITCNRTLRSHKRLFTDCDAWQYHGIRTDCHVALNCHSLHDFAGRMGVVGQHDMGQQPDEIMNGRVLADHHVALQAHEIADGAMPLNVALGPYLERHPSLGLLAHRDVVPGHKMIPKHSTFIEHTVRSDQCMIADG